MALELVFCLSVLKWGINHFWKCYRSGSEEGKQGSLTLLYFTFLFFFFSLLLFSIFSTIWFCRSLVDVKKKKNKKKTDEETKMVMTTGETVFYFSWLFTCLFAQLESVVFNFSFICFWFALFVFFFFCCCCVLILFCFHVIVLLLRHITD